MDLDKNRYRAYLLRLWQVKEQGRLVWRASLEDAHPSKRFAFGNLEELFHYLQQTTEGLPTAPGIAEQAGDCELISAKERNKT